MSRRYRATLAQTAPELLDIPHNETLAAEALERASARGASLVVFPEMHLSGYGITREELLPRERLVLERDLRRSLDRLAALGERLGVDYLMGYPLFEGNRTFIAAAYVERGQTVAVHRKLNLANYGSYEEHRNFDPGEAFTVVSTRLGTLGILICEDLWHPVNAAVCAAQGMEILLAPSAPGGAPLQAGNNRAEWLLLTQGIAFAFTSYLLCVTRGGAEKGTVFNGGAFALSPEGRVLVDLPLHSAAEGDVDIDRDALADLRRRRPLLANERYALYAEAFRGSASKPRETPAPV